MGLFLNFFFKFLKKFTFSQNPEVANQSENALHPLNLYYGDSSNHVEHSRDLSADDQKPMIGMDENQHDSELRAEQKFSDMPRQYEMDTRQVKDEYIESSNNVRAGGVNYLLDEPYLDATDNPPFSDGLYLEANDLSHTLEADSEAFDMVEEYLNFFDANDDNSEYLTFDASEIMGNENNISDQAPLTTEVQVHFQNFSGAFFPLHILNWSVSDISFSNAGK